MLSNFRKHIKDEPPIFIFIGVWFTFLVIGGILLSRGTFSWNALGDTMGGIFGTLVSTLTLIFVAYSFQTQREALATQRKELSETRAEMKNSTLALNQQVKIAKQSEYQNQALTILELANKHLDTFKYQDAYGNLGLNNFVDSYFGNYSSAENLYRALFKGGYFSSLHLYFETMLYLEKYISSLPKENYRFQQQMFGFIESQISDNLRNAYNILTCTKIAWEKSNYKEFDRLFKYSGIKSGEQLKRISR